ncbi:unnamed protein product, partial [Fusarium equiseti]
SCANLPLCVAAVYNSGFNDCNLYAAAAGGVRFNPAYDFAMKAASEPEPQPTSTAEATTSEATTSEAQSTTTTSSEPTPTEVSTSEALSEPTSQATVGSTEVTSSIESSTIATTSEIWSTAITSIETSTDAETSTIPEVVSTSEATTVPETATTAEEPTTSGTTSLETSALDTTTLKTISTSEVSTASETSALETSTIVAGSTTNEPGSSSTSEVPTETDDCDESSITESALPTTTLQPSEPLTTLTTSTSMTQDIPSASESSSIASHPDSAVSSPCIIETQAATATTGMVQSRSTSTLTVASSSSAGSKTVSDYALPATVTSQYGLPTSKVITVTEGGHVVTKTVPCDTPVGTKGYKGGQASSNGIKSHQTRTSHSGYGDVQPTTGSQGYLPPNHEGGGSYEHGSSSDNGGSYGADGSYASIDNHQTGIGHNGHASAQPTAGSHTDVHSEYENGLPSGTGHNVHIEAHPTHGGSQSGYRNGHSYVPVPTQGHHSKPQPGHENTQPDHEKAQPSVSIHGSPEGNNNGASYPTQGHVAHPITSAPESANSSPVTQGQESASTTLTTKAVPTNDAEAPKSTENTVSSRPGDEPSKPVAVSGANRYQVMAWTWMGRRSEQLDFQTAETVIVPVEEVKNALKRKASASKSHGQPLQKTTKARSSATSKVKRDVQGSVFEADVASEKSGQSSVQTQIHPSIGRLSCLPPEIDDNTCLKNLIITSKALYSLAVPQLFKRIERSCALHVHIAKLIKTTEPFLSIEQRKQLKKEGIYKGQQETFPDDVNPKKNPGIANYVRRALVETGDPGKRHRYIVHRYVEELLKNLDNLELWGGTMLTEYVYGYWNLKALWLNTNVPITSESHSADALSALKDLEHLSFFKDAFWGRRGWSKTSPEILIWNSRSTLRSLALNDSTFHYMHFQWEEAGQEPPRPGYLSALKTFSLTEGEFDDEQTGAILQAIDFVKLQELSLGRGNTRVGLLYRRLTDIFTAARGDIKLRSLYMDLQEDADEGIQFLSTFDTLRRLKICDNGAWPEGTREPSLQDSLFRGLYMHKNLTVLKLTDETYTTRDRMPGLDAETAAQVILNFPNLRHLHFNLHEPQLEEVSEALSHAKNLEKIPPQSGPISVATCV